MQELEFIKRVIFDIDQQNLINFISKPLISIFDLHLIENGTMKNDFFSFEKMIRLEKEITPEDLKNIHVSYKNLLKNFSQTQSNINLVNIFESKIQYLS